MSATQDAGNGDGNGGGVTVTVAVQGSATGHVVSMPAGIDCPGTCSASFATGTTVMLMAAPDTGAVFAGYTGGCMGLDPSCTVTAGADQTVNARFVKSGEKRFAKQIDGASIGTATIAGAGKIVVAGGLADYSGLYISARSTTDGSVIWEQTYPGVLYPWLTTAPNGDIVLAAEFTGTPTLAGRTLANGGGIDCLVARISPADGAVTWVKEFGGTNYDDANAIAVTSDNTIYVAGNYSSPTFVVGTTTMTNGSTSNANAWLAAIDSGGAVVWAKQYGSDAGAEGIRGLTLDTNENAVATGTFTGQIILSTTLVYNASNGPASDGFVVTVRKSDGVALAGKQVGSTMNDYTEDVIRTGDGGYVLAGTFQGAQSFGGATLSNNGSDDIFLVRYTAGGAHAWSGGFGSTGADRANGTTLDNHGAMLVAGYYNAAIDFGGGLLPNAGGQDGFILKLNAAGTHAWSYRYGGNGSDSASAAVVDARDIVYVVGAFSGTADVADETFTSATFASFLVSYWP